MSMLWIINWEEREIEDCYLVVRKNEFDGFNFLMQLNGN